MKVRHIRPSSLEWNDVVSDERPRATEPLSPEETQKLRAMFEMGEAPNPEGRDAPTQV